MAQIEMLAAVCTSPGEGDVLELRRVRVDDPHEMEVRVKLETTGICRSDIHYLRGVWAHPKPVILGHEGTGTENPFIISASFPPSANTP